MGGIDVVRIISDVRNKKRRVTFFLGQNNFKIPYTFNPPRISKSPFVFVSGVEYRAYISGSG